MLLVHDGVNVVVVVGRVEQTTSQEMVEAGGGEHRDRSPTRHQVFPAHETSINVVYLVINKLINYN